jgi:hypothetical protein
MLAMATICISLKLPPLRVKTLRSYVAQVNSLARCRLDFVMLTIIQRRNSNHSGNGSNLSKQDRCPFNTSRIVYDDPELLHINKCLIFMVSSNTTCCFGSAERVNITRLTRYIANLK